MVVFIMFAVAEILWLVIKSRLINMLSLLLTRVMNQCNCPRQNYISTLTVCVNDRGL